MVCASYFISALQPSEFQSLQPFSLIRFCYRYISSSVRWLADSSLDIGRDALLSAPDFRWASVGISAQSALPARRNALDVERSCDGDSAARSIRTA